jgi:hypothetical protein
MTQGPHEVQIGTVLAMGRIMSRETESKTVILAKIVEKRIFLIRGSRVVLSTDLADLYQVSTKTLTQAVKRNIGRFPDDFLFQLSMAEATALSRSQFVTLKHGHNIKYAPYAFTEQGVAMLSGVLRSPIAIKVNIEIMRAFVRLRELVAGNSALLVKVEALEKKFEGHDQQLKEVFATFRELLSPARSPKKQIGIRMK